MNMPNSHDVDDLFGTHTARSPWSRRWPRSSAELGVALRQATRPDHHCGAGRVDRLDRHRRRGTTDLLADHRHTVALSLRLWLDNGVQPRWPGCADEEGRWP